MRGFFGKWSAGFRRLYRNASLRDKLIASYLLLLVIPMTVASLLFYRYAVKIVQQQTTDVIANNMRRGAAYLGSTLGEVEELGDVFYENANLQTALARRNVTDYDDVEEYQTIIGALRQISNNAKVSAVRLYVPDWKFYANEGSSVFPFTEIGDDPAVSELMKQGKIKGWYTSFNTNGEGNGGRFLSYVVLIVDLDNIGKTIGALRIDIPESDISQSIGAIGDGTLTIFDQNGALVAGYGSDAKKLSENLYGKGSGEVSRTVVRGKPYLLINELVPTAGWQLQYAIPSRSLTGKFSDIRLFTILVFLALFMISVGGAAVMSRQMAGRITGLAQRMTSIRSELNSEETFSLENCTGDEIGQLNRSFEQMVANLRRLIREKYQAQLQMREMRLLLLQAQINPHFLYNVLDQINWMAVRAGVPAICEMTANLGRFYRIGLSKGKDVIRLSEELEHVRLYTELQKYSLGDAVAFTFDVDESAGGCRIIKLVLQPLVENAIVHGILETDGHNGDIRIRTARENDRVSILVKDSAGLLQVEKVRSAFSRETDDQAGGYGLKNVDERLRLFFGEDGGLTYYVDEDGWSVFRICIPFSEEIPRPDSPA